MRTVSVKRISWIVDLDGSISETQIDWCNDPTVALFQIIIRDVDWIMFRAKPEENHDFQIWNNCLMAKAPLQSTIYQMKTNLLNVHHFAMESVKLYLNLL